MSKTAAILIIGNEILSGKTQDSNSHYLAMELRKLGVELREIRTIPDEVTRIAEVAKELSEQFDVVFTSGGVGPTHDDVTLEGIAQAFGVPIIRKSQFRNVFIFPGIPEIFREKFEAVKESFRESPYHQKIIYTRMGEGKLARYLNQLLETYPELMLGSYPELNNPDYRVKVTAESKDLAYLEEAFQSLIRSLPQDSVVNVE